MIDLDSYSKDILREAGNIFSQRTVNPIQQILNMKVEVQQPVISLENMEFISDNIGPADKVSASVYIKIKSTGKGAFLLFVNPDDLKIIFQNVDQNLHQDALKEISNILAGTCLGALAKFTDMEFLQSIPELATDMNRAIINQIVSEIGTTDAELLSFYISLNIGDNATPIYVMIIFDSTTSEEIILSIKKDLQA